MEFDALVGTRVCITGVQARPELNGTIATIARYDRAKGRFGLLIDGKEIGLKPQNLLRLTASEAEFREWCAEVGPEHAPVLASLDLEAALQGGQMSLLDALKAAGVKSLGMRLKLAALLQSQLLLSSSSPAPAPAPVAFGPSTEDTTLAAVDPRYKKINPKMQECAELLGIPKDATMDMAMKMLAHTISEEGVTGEQMKAAMEELQIGVGDGFEDEWT